MKVLLTREQEATKSCRVYKEFRSASVPSVYLIRLVLPAFWLVHAIDLKESRRACSSC